MHFVLGLVPKRRAKFQGAATITLLYHDDAGKIRLTQDLLNEDMPPYAILSHTWGHEEVVFAELRDDGLRYFWVDTCCIDKSKNTDLQEAITVYVSTRTPDDQPSWIPTFRRSRWFTRGWMLREELIAPKSVELFSRESVRLGDRNTLEKHIHDRTGIPLETLRGGSLSDVSVSDRTAWIEKRNTIRAEDKAYSLLGIFSIYMQIIYGEGEKSAFQRLREEIRKSSKSEHSFEEDEVCCLTDPRLTSFFRKCGKRGVRG
ncbi:het-domain protein [Rhypophila decipiens]